MTVAHPDVAEPLAPADLLARRDLTLDDDRSSDFSGEHPAGGVRCGRPLVYPVPVDDLPPQLRHRARTTGSSYAGALFAFDLEDLPPRRRYAAARFEVELAEQRALAVQVHGDGDSLGLTYDLDPPQPASATAAHTLAAARYRPGWLRRLGSRRGTPRAWVFGVQRHQFGWAYDDPRGDVLLPRAYGMHALIELPPGATEVHGSIDVRVGLVEAGLLGAVQRGGMSRSVPFAEPLSPPAGTAAVRLCMAADVAGYSRRINTETERIQRDLVAVLARARHAAGIAGSAVTPQQQGDGEFTVLPTGIDESVVIPRLLAGLRDALYELNSRADPADRIRLRLALHRGLVKPGANGWVGSAAIAVHRLLDSAPLRSALREHADTDLVLGVPDVLFRDVLAHAVEPPLPGDFTPITVDLPEKGFIEHGWLHVTSGRPR